MPVSRSRLLTAWEPPALEEFFLHNPAHRKRILEFVDKDHPVMSEFYNLMTKKRTPPQMEKKLRVLIEKDPGFLDPYVQLSHLLLSAGAAEEGCEIAAEAFSVAQKMIADREGNWPERMEWGWLENRHILRALHHFGWLLWRMGHVDHSLAVFRRIIRMNPNDNQGIRWEILAIRLGLDCEYWDEPFYSKDGPFAGETYDGSAIEKWFERESKKFPEEFAWLFDEWKRSGAI
jgi:hypothetical protein